MNSEPLTPLIRIIRVARCAFAAGVLTWLAAPLPAVAQPARSDDARSADERIGQLTEEVRQLRALVIQLNTRLDDMHAPATGVPTAPSAPSAAVTGSGAGPAAASAGAAPTTADAFKGLTINATLDSYFAYNANDPIGRVNYLRAYDVSSNTFSLNQAAIILESAPDPTFDKRFGFRVDLQYGQATETLQGNAANELRPNIYRNVYQAYGTYDFPIGGKVLELDFGKWASSLGLEGNYTKDQMNYSRSFWFSYLPFYHSGVRAAFKVNDALTLNYWVTNGTQQTEEFNNFKDQLVGFTLQPTATVNWTFNYYVGQEHPDVVYVTNPALPNLPIQQGTPFLPIANAPNGRLEIFDTYATWQATPLLTLAAEVDWVTDRLYSYSPGQHTAGGALYGRYQLNPRIAFAARGEYLEDRGGLFSGVAQYLKEMTLTTEYRFLDGFIARGEFRRDASNQPYFLSDSLGVLKSHQDTYTLGLVWWVGQKSGSW